MWSVGAQLGLRIRGWLLRKPSCLYVPDTFYAELCKVQGTYIWPYIVVVLTHFFKHQSRASKAIVGA